MSSSAELYAREHALLNRGPMRVGGRGIAAVQAGQRIMLPRTASDLVFGLLQYMCARAHARSLRSNYIASSVLVPSFAKFQFASIEFDINCAHCSHAE